VIRINGADDAYLEENVEQLLTRRAIESRGVAVAIDGEVVPRSTWASTTVPDGASVEIVTAAAGG
jgi:sulfur carrier protein